MLFHFLLLYLRGLKLTLKDPNVYDDSVWILNFYRDLNGTKVRLQKRPLVNHLRKRKKYG